MGQSEAPPIHLINLDRSLGRLAEFTRKNPHLTGVVRYPAVDGSRIDRKALITAGVLQDDCPYADGTLGCALSHVSLWEMAVDENRPITIFEDDVVAANDFVAHSTALIGTLPRDWDLISWGYALEFKAWIDIGIAKINLSFYELSYAEAAKDPVASAPRAASLFPLLNVYGAISYSISPRGAQKLLDICLPLRRRSIDFHQPGVSFWDEGIDGPMNAAYGEMKSFISIPPLVWHDPPEDAASDRKSTDGA